MGNYFWPTLPRSHLNICHDTDDYLISVRSAPLLLTPQINLESDFDTMDLPSKLLSFYLSLANEGVPISLNIWTEKGSEGHFF